MRRKGYIGIGYKWRLRLAAFFAPRGYTVVERRMDKVGQENCEFFSEENLEDTERREIVEEKETVVSLKTKRKKKEEKEENDGGNADIKQVVQGKEDGFLEESPSPGGGSLSKKIVKMQEPEPSELAWEIINFRDWIEASLHNAKKKEMEGDVQEVLESVHEKLSSLLELEEISTYDGQTGIFDPSRQKAVLVVEATDDSKKGCVHTSIRSGYMFRGKVIRYQQVSIFK